MDRRVEGIHVREGLEQFAFQLPISLISANLPRLERIVSIGEAAKALGVSITTPHRWEASGKRVAKPTTGGHRRSDLTKIKPERVRAEADAPHPAPDRVSGHDR